MTDNLHLGTLKYVRDMILEKDEFAVFSHLCRLIDEEEKRLADQARIEAEPGYCKHCGTNPCKNEGLTMTLTDDDPDDDEDMLPHPAPDYTTPKAEFRIVDEGDMDVLCLVCLRPFMKCICDQRPIKIITSKAPGACLECGKLFCSCGAPRYDNQIKFP